MAVPTFVSAGATTADIIGGASTTPTPPTHQTNDILIAAAINEAGVMSTVTSGWASIVAWDSADQWFNVFWKRATGAGTAGPTITAVSTDQFAICYVFRGCIVTGNPYEDPTTLSDSAGTDTTPETALITTTAADRLAVCFEINGGDEAWSSGVPPSGWTDNGGFIESAAGTMAGFQVISKAVASAGDVAATTVGTFTSGAEWGTLTVALIPPVPPPTLVVRPRYRTNKLIRR